MKRIIPSIGALALVALVLPVAASAQDMPMAKPPEGHAATVSGTVIDLSCKFRHNLTGEGHRMCAQVCADLGIPLAILGDDGTLYMPVSAGMPGENQNEALKEYAEQKVTVQGTVFEAGGAKAIQIESVTRS